MYRTFLKSYIFCTELSLKTYIIDLPRKDDKNNRLQSATKEVSQPTSCWWINLRTYKEQQRSPSSPWRPTGFPFQQIQSLVPFANARDFITYCKAAGKGLGNPSPFPLSLAFMRSLNDTDKRSRVL